MSIRLLISAAAAFMVSIGCAHATTTIAGSYTAVNNQSGSNRPTINYDGQPFLPSPFTENLTVGTTTATQTFLQIAPASGGSGTLAGSIAINMTLTDAANSAVTGFYTTGGGSSGATLSHGVLGLTAYYDIYYGNQTDCVAWNSTSCTPTDNTTTIGETVYATFADGALLAINLYNWSDWDMAPNISFDLVNGPTPAAVPEPSSIAVFGGALIGLGVLSRRRRRGKISAGIVSPNRMWFLSTASVITNRARRSLAQQAGGARIALCAAARP
jgi:hypothetical protein